MSFHKANKQNKKLKAIGLWISTPVYKTTHYPEEPYLSVLLCYLRGEKKLLHAVNLNRYKNAHKSSCQRTLTYSPTLGYADRSSVPPPGTGTVPTRRGRERRGLRASFKKSIFHPGSRDFGIYLPGCLRTNGIYRMRLLFYFVVLFSTEKQKSLSANIITLEMFLYV